MNPGPRAAALSVNMLSIVYMVLACACFAGNDLSTKLAVHYLPAPEIMVIRGCIAATLAFTLVCIFHGPSALKTIFNRHVFYRSGLESFISPILITSYFFLPIATVTAISQFSPILGMIAGIYLFREAVGWRRWIAAFVGFFGVMLIIKPGTTGFHPMAAMVLVVAMLTVARDIQSRKIGASAPLFVIPLASAIMNGIIASLLALALRPFDLPAWGAWVWPDAFSFAVVAATALFVVTAHTFSFLAFRYGDLSVVAPFRYIYLLFATLGGVVIFAEWPDWISLAGMMLIVAAGLYLLHRERRRGKQAAAGTMPR